MNVTQLDIAGAWHIKGNRIADDRGFFQEWYKFSALAEATGVVFNPVQANISRSSAGVIRGIHYSIASAGQGKLVTVMSGAIDDYVIDIRPSSPTFGQWRRVHLSSENGDALLIDPHLGHAFQALMPDTVVSYLVSAEFDPHQEKAITPFCPSLNIEWDIKSPAIVSEKDQRAQTLTAAARENCLPPMSEGGST